MKKQKIETPLVEIPRKGISQAIKFGNIMFVSGQCGDDAEGAIREGIEAQTEQAILNAKTIIEAAGASLEDVLMCRIFIRDNSLFEGMNKVYFKYFGDQDAGPARYTVVAPPVLDELLVEIAMFVGMPDEK